MIKEIHNHIFLLCDQVFRYNPLTFTEVILELALSFWITYNNNFGFMRSHWGLHWGEYTKYLELCLTIGKDTEVGFAIHMQCHPLSLHILMKMKNETCILGLLSVSTVANWDHVCICSIISLPWATVALVSGWESRYWCAFFSWVLC